MKLAYHLFILLLNTLMKLAALFNHKAKKWVNGRKHIFEELEKQIDPNAKYIWVHCASLGEFEQGRPVIEGLKKMYPTYKILLSFFSPSGYEVRKNYEFADIISYLPIDTLANAKRIVHRVNPKIAVFVKYEFWYNYLSVLKKNEIPVVFISSIFRPEQYFFKAYGIWFKKHLMNISHLFVQDKASKELLINNGIKQVSICGDTRFDRVYELAQHPQKFEIIERFKSNSQLIIAGSTWPPDEDLMLPLIAQFPSQKFIIAPHEVHPERIQTLQKRIREKSVLLSEAETHNNIEKFDVMIIDRIGILAHLYQYATIAYIGGGFGTAIHNIQEPVTFGIPVVFGPKYHKFREAVELVESGGASSIRNMDELKSVFSGLIKDSNKYLESCIINKKYVEKNIGATAIILNYFKKFLES